MSYFERNRFPYTNLQGLNLDWFLSTLRALNVDLGKFESDMLTALAKTHEDWNNFQDDFAGTWEEYKAEQLSIWNIFQSNYAAEWQAFKDNFGDDVAEAVANVLQAMLVDGDFDDYFTEFFAGVRENLQIADQSQILFVGGHGCTHATIGSAIAHARTYATQTRRVSIFVVGGVYEESVNLLNNPGIDIFGTGAVSVVNTSATFPDGCLRASGSFTCQNITFVNQVDNTHAVYLDGSGSFLAGNHTFINCKFYQPGASIENCVRIIAASGLHVTFTHCNFNFFTPASAGIYCASNSNIFAEMSLTVDSCSFNGFGRSLAFEDQASMLSAAMNSISVTLVNNTNSAGVAYGVVMSYGNPITTASWIVPGFSFIARNLHGNDSASQNTTSNTYYSMGLIFPNPVAGHTDMIIPVPFNPADFNLYPSSVIVSNIGAVYGFSIAGSSENLILLQLNNALASDVRYANVTLTTTPKK